MTVNIHNIFKNHNDIFISKYMIDNKKYLDDILKDVDPNIILDENQRKVVLTVKRAAAEEGQLTCGSVKVNSVFPLRLETEIFSP